MHFRGTSKKPILFFSKKHRRLTVGMEYLARGKSEYKWGDVCGKEHIEGEEEECSASSTLRMHRVGS
jgi:hypothetical protein